MKKAQFAIGIISGILLLPLTLYGYVIFRLAMAYAGSYAKDTYIAGGFFLVALVANIVIPVLICKQAMKSGSL